jgi:hypothetical protein
MSAACSANILEAIAVSGVDTNSLEPLRSNISNVGLNGALVLAFALRRVWRVGQTITGPVANLAIRVGIRLCRAAS